MMHREPQKVALITGANKGIGFELARQLGQAGWIVILTARHAERGAKAVGSLRVLDIQASFQPLDVTDPQTVQEAAQAVEREFGKLDVLVNNAGIILDNDAAAMVLSDETLRETLETNTLGPLRVTQWFASLLAKSGNGKVINISSGYGQLYDMEGGEPAAYKISKTALNAVTRILAGELAAQKIAVNAVCPGWVRTDMGGPNAMRSPEESAQGIVRFLLQDPMPTGGFFRDGQSLPW